jgi:DNA-binding response OmpR family regulator
VPRTTGAGPESLPTRAGSVGRVAKILVASDAPSVRREVASATSSRQVEVVEATSGPQVVQLVLGDPPDLVVIDMQMGNMGGMAVCLELRLEASYRDVRHVPVLMLLDRRPDVFLARRSGAEGWLVKPLDPLRLRRATKALLAGGAYHDESYRPVPVLAGTPAALGADGST